MVANGWAGARKHAYAQYNKTQSKHKWSLAQKRKTRWENVLKPKNTLTDMWQTDPNALSFWSGPSTMSAKSIKSPRLGPEWGKNHVLSNRPRVLGDGRYCWRHDLKEAAASISTAINTSKHNKKLLRGNISLFKVLSKYNGMESWNQILYSIFGQRLKQLPDNANNWKYNSNNNSINKTINTVILRLWKVTNDSAAWYGHGEDFLAYE